MPRNRSSTAVLVTLAAPAESIASPGEIFVGSRPWSSARPESLVVCCSDGRWHQHVEEFVCEQVSTRSDMYAVPGGPAGFSIWSSSFDESKVTERSFRFLADHHELEAVWLIAHQDCAYYRIKYGPLDDDFIFRRQCEDLDRAAETILRWYPRLLVRKVYASLRDGRVAFDTLHY
jgi:hypothetical protein